MRFQTKIFLAISASTSAFLVLMAFLSLKILRTTLEQEYFARYEATSQVVSDTLHQMEASNDLITVNAVKYLDQFVRRAGLPGENELKALRSELGVNLFVIADGTGRIVRDTDTPPAERRSTMFDFCEGYRGIADGRTEMEITPILPSYPSGRAYQFTMIPRRDQKGILEAGVQLNFIGEILLKALRSDKNLVSLGLYTPRGISLGAVTSQGIQPVQVNLPPAEAMAPQTSVKNGNLVFLKKVSARSEVCCECVKKGLTGSDGKYHYLLRTEVSLASLTAGINALRNRLLTLLAISLVGALFLARALARRLVLPLSRINAGVKQVIESGDLSLRLTDSGQDEVGRLAGNFNRMISNLEASQQDRLEAERSKGVATLASQVAHDIRSPLAALGMATKSLEGLPEEERTLIRSAVQRISDIANDLGDKRRPQSDGASKETSSQLIPTLIESVVSEKRMQYRGRQDLRIESSLERDAYGVFASLNTTEFKRAMSNLIDNSIEAITAQGHVEITLHSAQDSLRIIIQDNGKGIPPEVLPRLGTRGETYGKAGGSGLGLFHARQSLEKWGGSLEIRSACGAGTTVEIALPKAPTPGWFVPSISLGRNGKILILDDDSTIHEVWKKRFAAAGAAAAGIEAVHCLTSREALERIKQNGAREFALFLFDYELKSDSVTGLDLIEDLRIAGRSILVTSQYEQPAIRARCERLGMRILPKGMAAFVPIGI